MTSHPLIPLDPRLEKDTHAVIQWPLCRVVLMDDSRFPWLILVPDRPDMVEPFDLAPDDQARLWREAGQAASLLKTWAGADKANVAALGNQVRQLHVHVIARRIGDPAWPGPVWGVGTAEPYDPAALTERLTALRSLLVAPE